MRTLENNVSRNHDKLICDLKHDITRLCQSLLFLTGKGFLLGLLVLAQPFLGLGQETVELSPAVTPAPTPASVSTLEVTTVVATKTPKSLDELMPSVDTISGGELQARQLYGIENVLAFAPGTSVVQTGGAGSQTSLFIRGMESNHTVVLLNGRRLAPGLAGLYNLENLDTMWLDSVQLNRGPVSSLYGSDALAGALDLRMVDARDLEEGISASTLVEGGSFSTLRSGQQVIVKDGPVGLALDLSFHDTANDRIYSDFQNLNLRGNLAFDLGDRAWFDVLGYYQESKLQVPGSNLSSYFPETQRNENQSALLSPRFSIERDEWDFSVFYSYNTSELEATQDVFFQDNRLEQNSHEVEAQLNFHPTEEAAFALGGGWYGYEFSRTPLIPGPFNPASAKEFGYWSVFGQTDIDLPASFNFLGSARHDGHDSFESKATYSVQLRHDFEPTSTQVFGKIATGYKAPSGQDFVYLDPSVDPNSLAPEESQSWEIGVRQFLPGEAGSIAVTYFQAEVENLVDSFGFPALATSVDTQTDGIELEFVLTPTDHLRLFANYTWLDAVIVDGYYFGGFAGGPGDKLPRRPEHTLSGGLLYQADSWKIGAEFVSAFARLDSPGVTLDDYAVARIFGNVSVNDQMEIFGRLENVLDEDFETTTGYDAPGFGAFGGIRLTF